MLWFGEYLVILAQLSIFLGGKSLDRGIVSCLLGCSPRKSGLPNCFYIDGLEMGKGLILSGRLESQGGRANEGDYLARMLSFDQGIIDLRVYTAQ
jgi:hypothetical protein